MRRPLNLSTSLAPSCFHCFSASGILGARRSSGSAQTGTIAAFSPKSRNAALSSDPAAGAAPVLPRQPANSANTHRTRIPFIIRGLPEVLSGSGERAEKRLDVHGLRQIDPAEIA